MLDGVSVDIALRFIEKKRDALRTFRGNFDKSEA
jgi:hypothetical protein